MAAGATNPKVEFFFAKAGKWQTEFRKLRTIMLNCGLTEELKWGCPCYTYDKRNIVLIHGFKDYCALLFIKGALLRDEAGILIQQTENVQSARQIRFTCLDDITRRENAITAYVDEAITVEKAGLKVALKKTEAFSMPDEFRRRLEDDPELSTAFHALTQGRQRGYLLHFSSAKQAATREARVEKCIPRILDGKGLDD